MKSKNLLAALFVLLGGGVVMLARGHHHPTVAAADDPGDVVPPAPAAEPEPPPAPRPPVAVQPVRRPPPAAPAFSSEASLMFALRDLGASNPARALDLSREGNRRFPNSSDAAERSWTICKSLAALGRSVEAQDEARRMVEQFPDTSWAGDVKRHLLTQPLKDPSQRGYGRSSELD